MLRYKKQGLLFFFSSENWSGKLNALKGTSGNAFSDYVGQLASRAGNFSANSSIAFSSRSIGNLSRPFFPDGIDGSLPGPFSLPFPGNDPGPGGRSWSPFNTGLQLDLILQSVLAPLNGVVPNACVNESIVGQELANGIQIFPGSVPLYRAGRLIGGIGVSGDGVDQDDLISFYSVSREGLDSIGRVELGDVENGFNAPSSIRSDNFTITPSDTRLRYVNCPESPFIRNNDQKVCL